MSVNGPDFEFRTVANVDFANGARKQIADVLAGLGATRPILVTDSGIVKLGLLDEVFDVLASNSIDYQVFSDVSSDPPEQNVLDAAAMAIDAGCDAVVGFGGGSPMDVAKLVSVLALPVNRNLALADIYGVDQIHSSRMPLIQVPTTAGTGSEVTSVAIITTGETTKSGVVSSVLLADHVLLDPILTVGLPAPVTAATGIDAMVHAIEAYTSKRLKNPVSDMLACQALRLINDNIRTAVVDGSNLAARGAMLLGAMMAGQAFANAPVGGVHALAYPLGGNFHVPHGLSNSLVLPHVLRFNAPAAESAYSEIADIVVDDYDPVSADREAAYYLADYFLQLAKELGLETRLQDLKIPASSLGMLADQAMLQQRLLINNPREMLRDQALNIYKAAF